MHPQSVLRNHHPANLKLSHAPPSLPVAGFVGFIGNSCDFSFTNRILRISAVNAFTLRGIIKSNCTRDPMESVFMVL